MKIQTKIHIFQCITNLNMENPIIIYISKVILTGLLICVIINLANIFVSICGYMNKPYKTCRTLTGKYVRMSDFPFDNKILIMVSSVFFIYVFISIIIHVWL